MLYRAESLKRSQIRTLALDIRTMVEFENKPYFPIMRFFEHAMPLLYPQFNYEIVEKDYFPPQKHAETDVVNHVIRIREDVYYRAVNGYGRDRMTVAHEAAHYILIDVCGVTFNRVFGSDTVVTYQDPEWQAKALAGELLCPYHLIRGMPPDKIANICGVSETAAVFACRLF
jgi:Zn-dependent peptidase ImmA (M78 family)